MVYFFILQINDVKKCLTCIVSWLFKNLNEYVQKHVCMTIKIIPCFNLCQGIYTPFPPPPICQHLFPSNFKKLVKCEDTRRTHLLFVYLMCFSLFYLEVIEPFCEAGLFLLPNNRFTNNMQIRPRLPQMTTAQ